MESLKWKVFYGSDLDVVTLLPPTFHGIELSHVTMAARSLPRTRRHLGRASTRTITTMYHIYLSSIWARQCSKHFISIDPAWPVWLSG